jgi:UV DNA damage repair endonuclease
MYRMAAGLAPYATHPDHLQIRDQVDECAGELTELSAQARLLGLWFSFHPSQVIVLNPADEDLIARSAPGVEG